METGRERHALVVCDMQPDLLGAIPSEAREALLEASRLCIDAARRASWLIIFTGVRFPPAYTGVSQRHRLYGGLQRLNSKLGDKAVHWFMEGFAGSEIAPQLGLREGVETVVFRQQHLPTPELLGILAAHGTTKAAVIGLKAGYAVQATCQALCDASIFVSVVRECVGDDIPERLTACLDHLLPV